MAKTIIQGPLRHRIRSLAASLAAGTEVLGRRLLRRPLVAEWPPLFEYGTLYYRAQFNHALGLASIAEGRAYFDSVYALLDEFPDVTVQASGDGEPRGHWFIPSDRVTEAPLLYFHGGGYTFYFEVTRHFIALLAHTLRTPIFAPDYRLTPEHPHPAQLEDGLAAYRFLLARGTKPEQLVVGGDSAGGHLALMLLSRLRAHGLPQPRLAFALSPWTDIGRRGRSQFGHDRYDMVQGYMTLRFGEWLRGGGAFTNAELSPIYQELRGLAPVYLQAGGKEILVDMIRDYAAALRAVGGTVRLEVWKHMNHEFQAYGEHLPESCEALERLRLALQWARDGATPFPACPRTESEGGTAWFDDQSCRLTQLDARVRPTPHL